MNKQKIIAYVRLLALLFNTLVLGTYSIIFHNVEIVDLFMEIKKLKKKKPNYRQYLERIYNK